MIDLDVLHIGEFRFAGGSGRRLAHEIDILSDLGIRIGLLPVATPRFNRGARWNPLIVEVARRQNVEIITPDAAVRTGTAVLRHPSVLVGNLPTDRSVSAARVIMVANQSRHADKVEYDAVRLHADLERWLGPAPEWFPINASVREELEGSELPVGVVSDRDWLQLPWRTMPAGELILDEENLKIVGAASIAAEIRTAGAANVLPPNASVRVWVGAQDGDWNEIARDALGAAHAGYRVLLPVAARDEIGWQGPTYSPGRAGQELRALLAEAPTVSGPGQALHDTYARALLARRYRIEEPLEGSARLPTSGTTQPKPSRKPVVIFVTSNGAGMGHLTRELGIARALEKWAKPIFVSLSQGVPVVNTFGFPFEYVPFTSALNSPPADWNRYFRARLARAIDTFDAKCVVFDGVWPYSGLVQAIRDKGVRSVWVRRGMWKPHISPDQLRTASHFDLVIEPGDYAASMDRGATAQVSDANKVEPVTVLSADELLERDAARRALRLPVDQKLALVTLGAGNINDIGDVQGAFVRAIQALGPDWRAVVTTPPIAERTGASAAYNVSVFPLARYANAFDFAVSATGYNSFHEWLVAGLPSIWVPNHATITDDQGARAEYADKVGLGISVDEPTRENIESAVSRMSDRSLQNEIRRRADALPRVNGSWQAAELIANLVRGVHI